MKIITLEFKPYRLEFTCPGLPPTTNTATRGKLRDRIKKKTEWKETVFYGTAGKRPPAALARARLTLTRFSTTRPDYDGLVSSFKHPIDALKLAGVIAEDRFENIGIPKYRWAHAPAGAGKIKVLVEELPADFEHTDE